MTAAETNAVPVLIIKMRSLMLCALAATEVSEGRASDVSRARGSQSVCDLGRDADSSGEEDREHPKGEMKKCCNSCNPGVTDRKTQRHQFPFFKIKPHMLILYTLGI